MHLLIHALLCYKFLHGPFHCAKYTFKNASLVFQPLETKNECMKYNMASPRYSPTMAAKRFLGVKVLELTVCVKLKGAAI
jgi:hypothetical protein